MISRKSKKSEKVFLQFLAFVKYSVLLWSQQSIKKRVMNTSLDKMPSTIKSFEEFKVWVKDYAVSTKRGGNDAFGFQKAEYGDYIYYLIGSHRRGRAKLASFNRIFNFYKL